MSNNQSKTCPLCGSLSTIFENPLSIDGGKMPFHYQQCKSGSCGLPCRVWDQVEQLQADNAQLKKMLELQRQGMIKIELWATPEGTRKVWPIVNGRMGEKYYDTPLEALEAAYQEWEKREGKK